MVNVLYARGKRFFSSPNCTERLWSPPSLIRSGFRGSFPVVKQPEREVSHSPPFSAKVKNERDYTYTSLI